MARHHVVSKHFRHLWALVRDMHMVQLKMKPTIAANFALQSSCTLYDFVSDKTGNLV